MDNVEESESTENTSPPDLSLEECFSQILAEVGDFGLYQKVIVFILAIPATLLSIYSTLNVVFLLYTPPHKCDSSAYNYSGTIIRSCEIFNPADNSTHHCQKWTFDREYFDETLVTKWSLVCEHLVSKRIILGTLTIAPIFSILITIISDKYGRKKAFMIIWALFLSAGLCSLLALNPVYFTLLKFLSSAICPFTICYCWALEFVGAKKRTYVTSLFICMYSLATMSLALVAYFCRTWLQMGLWTTAPFAVLGLYWFLVPESPMWLYTNGRFDEAVKILTQMATRNNMGYEMNASSMKQKLLSRVEDTKDSAHSQIATFFTSKNLRIKLAALIFITAVGDQLYYSIPYSMEYLKTNFYISFAFQSFAEIPASLTYRICAQKVGRVLLLAFSLLIGCVINLSTLLLAQKPAFLLIAAAGSRFFMTNATMTIALLYNEMFPTNFRNIAGGFYIAATALASCSSQYVFLLNQWYSGAPALVFSLLALTGSLMTLLLCETSGKPLPHTIHEAEEQGTVKLGSLVRMINLRDRSKVEQLSRMIKFSIHKLQGTVISQAREFHTLVNIEQACQEALNTGAAAYDVVFTVGQTKANDPDGLVINNGSQGRCYFKLNVAVKAVDPVLQYNKCIKVGFL